MQDARSFATREAALRQRLHDIQMSAAALGAALPRIRSEQSGLLQLLTHMRTHADRVLSRRVNASTNTAAAAPHPAEALQAVLHALQRVAAAMHPAT